MVLTKLFALTREEQRNLIEESRIKSDEYKRKESLNDANDANVKLPISIVLFCVVAIVFFFSDMC